MKTFMTAFVFATTVFAAQAQAFGPTMNNLVRDLNFPETISEPATKGIAQPGN